MSDQVAVLEKGLGPQQDVKISFNNAAGFSKVKNHLRQRHKRIKLHKRRLTEFERSYSRLALNNGLIEEKKRIDFVLVHENKSSAYGKDDEDKELQHEQDRKKFLTLLEKEGFTVQFTTIGKFVYTKLFCPFKRLCVEAEKVKFEMPLKDCPKLDPVSENCFTMFVNKHFKTDDEEDFISYSFIMDKIDKFERHEDPNTFFRPSVRSVLIHHILINLNIDEEMIDNQNEEETAPAPQKRKGLPYLLMKKSYCDAFTLHCESALSNKRGDKYLNVPDAKDIDLLKEDPRKDLDETWCRIFKFQPLWKIRNYFGERIAFYFAWSGMLITSLWIPTLFGLCVFFYGLYERSPDLNGATTPNEARSNSTGLADSFKNLFGDFKHSFDNSITPYFGLVICVWGTVFLEMWKRKRAELAYEWDVDQFEANEPDRPMFSGTKSKKDPVTAEYVWYYPFKRQIMKFCFSFSVLIMMILIVLISVVAIIIYRVIMDIDYCPTLPASECLMLTTVVSSVLNALSILLLAKLYNLLAKWLTEWENHRTQTQYDDALILKLFAFQFVNSYASCFYIAFFRGRFSSVGFLDSSKYIDSCEESCMTQLSFQILVLMLMKPLPKFLKDIVIEYIKRFFRERPGLCAGCHCCSQSNQVSSSHGEKAGGAPRSTNHHTSPLPFLQHEHFKPDLGDFTLDEYMEKIIQYGFLMLFATSFPLAPLLALLTNLFDIRVDAKRLLWWYRRPIAFVAEDIGMWYHILLFVNFCGVVSNAFLIAFTSNWGAKYDTVGKLIIVIGFEHIVFLTKYLVGYIIPDVPSNVQLSIRREKYQIQKIMEDSQKHVDFAHLFPIGAVNRIIHEADEDVEDGYEGTTQKVNLQSPGSHHPNLMQMPEPMNDLPVFYQNEGGQMLKSGAEEDGAPTKTDMDQAGLDQVSTSGVEPQGSTLWGSVPETQSIKSPNSHSQLAPAANVKMASDRIAESGVTSEI